MGRRRELEDTTQPSNDKLYVHFCTDVWTIISWMQNRAKEGVLKCIRGTNLANVGRTLSSVKDLGGIARSSASNLDSRLFPPFVNDMVPLGIHNKLLSTRIIHSFAPALFTSLSKYSQVASFCISSSIPSSLSKSFARALYISCRALTASAVRTSPLPT